MAWSAPDFFKTTRIRPIACLFCGLLLGILPLLLVAAQAPKAFLFDNFFYNGPINIAYRGSGAHFWPAAWSKTVFFFKILVEPANLLLVATFSFLNWPFSPESSSTYLQRFILITLPFAWFGALAATLLTRNTIIPVASLVVLGIAAGLPGIHAKLPKLRRATILICISVAVGVVRGSFEYRSIFQLSDWKEWTPIQIHDEGVALRKASYPGLILSLDPIVVLEGGMEIYPNFATGPFAWRTASYLTPRQRIQYKFVGENELETLLAFNRPTSILTGRERKLEPALVAFAIRHNYHKIKLPHKKDLWIAPKY